MCEAGILLFFPRTGYGSRQREDASLLLNYISSLRTLSDLSVAADEAGEGEMT